MIAFGIDPGSRKTGFGVLRVEGSAFKMVDAQVIRLDTDVPLSERLKELYVRLTRALEEHAPDRVFLESIFHQKSAQSALVLGQARGVALLAASLHDRPIGEVTPAEVKKSVTGRGNADKTQVKEMVRALLGLERRLAEDASDALAIAIAGVGRARFEAALERGRAQPHPAQMFGRDPK